ncbi:MAG: chemotaxis protein CheB [Pedobacter sp.]|nr:MAG: chemotaxis protein CheB [Pedobacter sp.]
MTGTKYIIAIGASAGGLKALSEFFDHTLPDGISYVITTHLDPNYKSELSRIIQGHSKIKVCEVIHDLPIEPNTVYVMPENKVMGIRQGKLILMPRDLSIKVNMAIDIFFKSLAEDSIFDKIAIILSGLGKDGTKGVKMLAEQGAYILVQTSLSASESSMPDSVKVSGYANQILDPKDMPAAIIKYITSK